MKPEVIRILDDRCSKCVQMNYDISDVFIFKLLNLFHAQKYCRVNIIILVITSMQCIHNYVPETNHVPTVHSVAAVLYLQFLLHVMLFRP